MSARRSRHCSRTSRARPSWSRDLDPEEARAIIDPALKLMIDAAHRYDGYVVQSTGDGIFALFGAPVAPRTIRNGRFTPPSDHEGRPEKPDKEI